MNDKMKLEQNWATTSVNMTNGTAFIWDTASLCAWLCADDVTVLSSWVSCIMSLLFVDMILNCRLESNAFWLLSWAAVSNIVLVPWLLSRWLVFALSLFMLPTICCVDFSRPFLCLWLFVEPPSSIWFVTEFEVACRSVLSRGVSDEFWLVVSCSFSEADDSVFWLASDVSVVTVSRPCVAVTSEGACKWRMRILWLSSITTG